jgi:hypothetical protein
MMSHSTGEMYLSVLRQISLESRVGYSFGLIVSSKQLTATIPLTAFSFLERDLVGDSSGKTCWQALGHSFSCLLTTPSFCSVKKLYRQIMEEFLGGITERNWQPLFGFPLKHTTVGALGAVMCEDAYVQNRLLVLYVKNNRIGKSIVCNELLNAVLIKNVPLLTHFLC